MSVCGWSKNPNSIALRRILLTLSSEVASETLPSLRAGSRASRFMKVGEGISRSRPPLAAATPSWVAPQSDIRMPSNPHSFLRISMFK